jgi:hypothetical protein
MAGEAGGEGQQKEEDRRKEVKKEGSDGEEKTT